MAPISPKLAMVSAVFGAHAAAGLMSSQATDESIVSEEALFFRQLLDRGLPAELNATRLRILTDLQSGRTGVEEEEGYDCEKLPHMCKAPFHCDQWTHQDTLDIRMHGLATTDGHANVRSWCMPGLERYASTVVKECVVNKDLRQSSKLQLTRTFDDWADELDASYCFAEGHCTNSVASDYTTTQDMENMCDYRFGGRRGWTRNFVNNLKRLMDMPRSLNTWVSAKSGISTQRITRILSKMSCAQGTFHCDVQYCKQTYCRDEYYVSKYGHLLPPTPGHLFQDPDLTKDVRLHESEDV